MQDIRLSVGDEVEVVDGPLRGYAGTVLRTKGDHVVVSIPLLRKSVAAEVANHQLRRQRLARESIAESLRQAVQPVSAELISRTIVTAEAFDALRLIDEGCPNVEVLPVPADLIQRAAANPDLLYTLHPRTFEEVMAELLRDKGYDVKLTPETHDGGRDILAVFPLPLGPSLTVVECKRFAAERRIGPEPVQRLLWVADNHDRASHALLATTSSFTAGAIALQKEYRWRLSLRDFASLSEWLKQYGTWRKSQWTPKTPLPAS